ncbi:MAG: metallophosphoesterase, partial [Candidatus Izemoplasmatales bacterium]
MNKKFTLRILSSSDIHGSILAKNYADNSKVNYGLSLLSSAIKHQRNDNTILVDLGDDLQGSPLMYFHQLNRKLYFNPLTKVFNYIGYDYFIPGNHDFNYGLEYLETFVKEINAKTLCSNIYKFGNELLFGLPYDIKKFDNGLKVVIVGLITQYIPNWENPSYIKDLT